MRNDVSMRLAFLGLVNGYVSEETFLGGCNRLWVDLVCFDLHLVAMVRRSERKDRFGGSAHWRAA